MIGLLSPSGSVVVIYPHRLPYGQVVLPGSSKVEIIDYGAALQMIDLDECISVYSVSSEEMAAVQQRCQYESLALSAAHVLEQRQPPPSAAAVYHAAVLLRDILDRDPEAFDGLMIESGAVRIARGRLEMFSAGQFEPLVRHFDSYLSRNEWITTAIGGPPYEDDLLPVLAAAAYDCRWSTFLSLLWYKPTVDVSWLLGRCDAPKYVWNLASLVGTSAPHSRRSGIRYKEFVLQQRGSGEEDLRRVLTGVLLNRARNCAVACFGFDDNVARNALDAAVTSTFVLSPFTTPSTESVASEAAALLDQLQRRITEAGLTYLLWRSRGVYIDGTFLSQLASFVVSNLTAQVRADLKQLKGRHIQAVVLSGCFDLPISTVSELLGISVRETLTLVRDASELFVGQGHIAVSRTRETLRRSVTDFARVAPLPSAYVGAWLSGLDGDDVLRQRRGWIAAARMKVKKRDMERRSAQRLRRVELRELDEDVFRTAEELGIDIARPERGSAASGPYGAVAWYSQGHGP
jgi:hypothetical protein